LCEKLIELVEYIARGLPEQDRPAYIQSAQERIAAQEGQPPVSENEDLKREIFTWFLGEVKSLGEGTDRGTPFTCPKRFFPHKLSLEGRN
jgi:translation initiation factor 3 subunit M